MTACAPVAVPRPASVGPSEAPAAVSIAPSPSVVVDAHSAAIAAFVDSVTGGDLSYRMGFSGQVAASVDVLPVEGSTAVSGADFSTSFTYDFDPEYPGLGKKKVQVRGVGEKGWIKRGSGAWKAIKGYGIEDSYVPFKAVASVADVKYRGTADVGGKSYHKVSIPGSLLIHPSTIPYQIQKEKVDQSVLEVLLDDAGRPHSGRWHSVGQARVGGGIGQLQRVVYDLDLTFSKVGDEITIKRP
jgi:hypothetical protein